MVGIKANFRPLNQWSAWTNAQFKYFMDMVGTQLYVYEHTKSRTM